MTELLVVGALPLETTGVVVVVAPGPIVVVVLFIGESEIKSFYPMCEIK